MKKKETLSDKDKILFVSILIIAAVFGLLITSINTEPEPEVITKEYNGFIFTKIGKIWKADLRLEDPYKGWTRDYEIYFHYTPDEVMDIPSIQNSRNESTAPKVFLNSRYIYITTDPEYPAEVVLSGVEIAKIIAQVYEKEVIASLVRPDNRTDAPVVTCDDVDQFTKVIHLKLGDKTEVYVDNGCVIVEGSTPEDLLKAAEKLTYEMLKIL